MRGQAGFDYLISAMILVVLVSLFLGLISPLVPQIVLAAGDVEKLEREVQFLLTIDRAVI